MPRRTTVFTMMESQWIEFLLNLQMQHRKPLVARYILCVAAVILSAATGPIFHYSETWQLIINTGTTIVTFLMVFLIQNTQNRDGHALQTKLDEIIRSSNAEDEFMGIETMTDKELEVFT